MDSEAESEEHEEEEASEESESGVASLALTTAFVSRGIRSPLRVIFGL